VTASLSSLIPDARDRPGNDPIFALNAEAQARAAAGESIINATLGALMTDDGQLFTMPTVMETLARFQDRAAGYAPISGLPAFRDAVIQDLFGASPLANQAVAVATPGGTGAVYQAVMNFLEPGQAVLAPSFYWGPYTAISTHTGRTMDTFPMFAPDGSFDLEGMAAGLDRHLATQGRALLVLNFPCHNPTGYSLSQDEWRRIADTIAKAGARGPVTVLIDAAYTAFGGTHSAGWLNAVPGLLRNATVLVAWTASKSFAQYGARVGSLVALHRDPSEREQIGNALGYSCRATWSNCNHLGQLAVTELITNPELAERVDAERGQLATLLQDRVDAFNHHAAEVDLPMPRYDAGFFVAIFTRDEQVAAAAMRDVGVYVTPIPGAVRVAMCSTPAAAVPRLVEALQLGVAAR
jgi:aromatic-amino-acid transaminase